MPMPATAPVVVAAPPEAVEAGAAAEVRAAHRRNVQLRWMQALLGLLALAVGLAAAASPLVRAAVGSTVAVAAAKHVAPPYYRHVRVRWPKAHALFVLGFAALAPAFFSVYSGRVRGDCAQTDDAEAAAPRIASKLMLVSAAAQIFLATATVLPEKPISCFACLLLLRMLVACNKFVHGLLSFYYWVTWVTYLRAVISLA